MGTKREMIAAELRRQICNGELSRGTRMNQDKLAERFSTSITPVREALGMLQAEGVLVSEPHRGVRVATADLEQVKTVYLLRQLLEPYAMQRAMWRASPRDLHAATVLFQEMTALEEAGDPIGYNKANWKFHFAFYERCDDDGLRAEIALLWQRYPWDLLQVVEQRSTTSQQEHGRMLEAAGVGDIEAVAVATREHLRTSYLALAEYLEPDHEHSDPFPPAGY